TEMADPEHLARDLRQARSERHVEVVEHDLSELVGVVSRRRQDRGKNRREILWLLAEHLQAPVTDGGPGGRREPQMAREDILESFFKQHLDRLAKAIEQVRGRRIGKEA